MNAQFEQAESIFHAERGQSKTKGTNDGTSQKDNNSDTDMNDNRSSQQSRSLPTVIRLITGTLLDNSPYSSVYENMNDEHGTEHTKSDTNNSEATESNSRSNTPTLQQIAQQVAREENKYLDKNQYMMYEILSCTFLLSLLLTLGDNDGNTAIQMCLAGTLNQGTHTELTSLIDLLQSRGAREQLIMFATGFAGSGKSTAIKIAQCFF